VKGFVSLSDTQKYFNWKYSPNTQRFPSIAFETTYLNHDFVTEYRCHRLHWKCSACSSPNPVLHSSYRKYNYHRLSPRDH